VVVDWIHTVQKGKYWSFLLKTEMKSWVPTGLGDLLTSGKLRLEGTLCRKQLLCDKTKEGYIRE